MPSKDLKLGYSRNLGLVLSSTPCWPSFLELHIQSLPYTKILQLMTKPTHLPLHVWLNLQIKKVLTWLHPNRKTNMTFFKSNWHPPKNQCRMWLPCWKRMKNKERMLHCCKTSNLNTKYKHTLRGNWTPIWYQTLPNATQSPIHHTQMLINLITLKKPSTITKLLKIVETKSFESCVVKITKSAKW
jgi:hypothetical protein